jgi:hypothetical protein
MIRFTAEWFRAAGRLKATVRSRKELRNNEFSIITARSVSSVVDRSMRVAV